MRVIPPPLKTKRRTITKQIFTIRSFLLMQQLTFSRMLCWTTSHYAELCLHKRILFKLRWFFDTFVLSFGWLLGFHGGFRIVNLEVVVQLTWGQFLSRYNFEVKRFYLTQILLGFAELPAECSSHCELWFNFIFREKNQTNENSHFNDRNLKLNIWSVKLRAHFS